MEAKCWVDADVWTEATTWSMHQVELQWQRISKTCDNIIIVNSWLLHFLSSFQVSMSDDFEQTSLFTNAASNTSVHLCNLLA